MEIGEIIGILFLLALIVVFAIFVYRNIRCPACGGLRTNEIVEVEELPLDTERDAIELFGTIFLDGDDRHKSSTVIWIERCKKCGYQTKNTKIYRHH